MTDSTIPTPLPESEATPQQRQEEARARLDAVLEKHLDALDRGDLASLEPREQPLQERVVGRIVGVGWTLGRQRAFLRHLAENASVVHACRHVGLSKQSAYALRNKAPTSVFAICWKVAAHMGRRRLWDEAMERALEGREEAVWYRGEQVGTRIVHNDRLLMFLLAHPPEAAHPNLTQAQLEELWDTMMGMTDAVLPPTLTPERLADLSAPDERR